MGHYHPALVELVKECLHNDPDQRPTTGDLLARLQRMREEVEGQYGYRFKLDMARVRLAKEVQIKDRRIEEMTQQQVYSIHPGMPMDHFTNENQFFQQRHEAESAEKTRELEAKSRELEDMTRQLEVLLISYRILISAEVVLSCTHPLQLPFSFYIYRQKMNT